MAMGKLLNFLVETSAKERPLRYKIVVMLAGFIAFLVVLHGLLFLLAYLVDKYLIADRLRYVEMALGGLSAIVGLSLLA